MASMPKTAKDLASQIKFREMTGLERLLLPNTAGYYLPVLGVSVNTKDKSNNIISTLIHEMTHKLASDIDANQVIKDMKLLATDVDPFIEALKEEYPKFQINSELLARFAESFPDEILYPVTPTGKKLHKLYADYFKWDTNETSLINDLLKELETTNKKNLPEKSKNIVYSFLDKFKGMVERGIGTQYMKTKGTVSRENGVKPVPTDSDYEIINSYANSPLLWDSYSNLSQAMTRKVNSILASSFKGGKFNPAEAKKRLLSEVPQLTKARVNTILRTEYSNIQKISKDRVYNQLDPNNTFKYKWVGPSDNRTTDICYRIQRRTVNGVSLSKLKQIIAEEADPLTYTKEREFVPHINCRHTFIKI